MGIDCEKSPCIDCPIHLKRLNKKLARYPCATCRRRMEYADRIYGMPARPFGQDASGLYNASDKGLKSIDDGLKIVDLGAL